MPRHRFRRERAELVTLDWLRLSRSGLAVRGCAGRVKVGGCDWIDDASIADCLARGFLEDASQPQTAGSHHAARVAWLVALLGSGADIDPIEILVTPQRVLIFDGSHRLRALQYLGLLERVAVLIDYGPPRLAPFYAPPGQLTTACCA